jgi:NitT/TauT family transport system substrate-binding protein
VKKRANRGVAVLSVALATVLGVAGCGGGQATNPAAQTGTQQGAGSNSKPPEQPIKLGVSYSAISPVFSPLWVARDNGIFAKYGLDVNLVYLVGGSTSVQALISGDTPIGMFNVGSAVDSHLEGTDSTVIAKTYDRYFFYIYGKKELKSLNDLKGKTIAASKAGAATDFALTDALGRLNYVRNKDYKVAFVGGVDALLSTLTSGVVDATVIPPPYGLEAKKQGFVEVANLMERDDLLFGYAGVVASDKWAKENPQVVERFLKAYVEAIQVMKKDKALAKKIIGKYTQTTDDAILEESYRVSIPLLPDKPFVNEATIKASLDLSSRPNAKGSDPKQFYDNRYVQSLEDQGFFKEVLK